MIYSIIIQMGIQIFLKNIYIKMKISIQKNVNLVHTISKAIYIFYVGAIEEFFIVQ